MSAKGKEGTDKVLLHQLPREAVRRTPSSSPACLKLETYLRMAKIPYENVYGIEMSSKGKCPWIEYKEEKVADSNFCVWYLNEKFDVDLDEHLSPAERGIAHAFRTMLEENTYWTLCYDRFVENYDETYNNLYNKMPWYMGFWLPRSIKNRVVDQMQGHGIGRHSREEIYGIAERDFKAVSDFLGEKKFLMGERPSLVDCSVFGLVTNCIWQYETCLQGAYIKKRLTNLEPYCQRMKFVFYPDWDDILKQ